MLLLENHRRPLGVRHVVLRFPRRALLVVALQIFLSRTSQPIIACLNMVSGYCCSLEVRDALDRVDGFSPLDVGVDHPRLDELLAVLGTKVGIFELMSLIQRRNGVLARQLLLLNLNQELGQSGIVVLILSALDEGLVLRQFPELSPFLVLQIQLLPLGYNIRDDEVICSGVLHGGQFIVGRRLE